LSAEQLATLRRELDAKLASSPSSWPKHTGKCAELTMFGLLEPTGLMGCIKGKTGSPTDVATNPDHMEGFGRG
jgi:hypothetical protein